MANYVCIYVCDDETKKTKGTKFAHFLWYDFDDFKKRHGKEEEISLCQSLFHFGI